MSYQPILTQAGLNAAVSASDAGIKLSITHVALGDAGYTPRRNAVALTNERVRVAVTDGRELGEGLLAVNTLIESTESFPVNEVGFFSNSVLVALWSHTTNTLLYITPKTRLVQQFDLQLSDVPPGTITVNQTGALNTALAPEFFNSAIASTRMACTQVAMLARQLTLTEQLRRVTK